MSDPPTRMRPPSFSESHIYLKRLPRVESNQKPLISLALPEPLDLVLDDISSPRPPLAMPTWSAHAHIWAIRFALHLTLISAFETVFFWLFVSKSEDQALTSLINNYVDGAITGCQNLTESQHSNASAFLAALFNQSDITAAGITASTDRAIYNGLLLRNSWVYFAAIALLFGTLSVAAKIRRLRINWIHVIGENLVLVTLLGVYELMFFRTVVFQYRATTMEELDQMVVGELMDAC
jgi:hypothetical protein